MEFEREELQAEIARLRAELPPFSGAPPKIEGVESFVRKILQENFNQKIDPPTLRSVAQKVSRAIEAIAATTPEKGEGE